MFVGAPAPGGSGLELRPRVPYVDCGKTQAERRAGGWWTIQQRGACW